METFSPHTRAAYKVDLTQAFALSFDPEASSSPFPSSQSGGGLGRLSEATEEQLLHICRTALSNWSPLSPASRNRKTATLKSFLGWLHQSGAIGRNLSPLLSAPKVPKRLPNFLSVDEALALIRSAQQRVKTAANPEEQKKAERELALISLLYGGGLRVSEACQLTWKQVDLEARVIRVLGKGGKERQLALPALSIQALKRLRAYEGPYVWGETALSTRVAYEIVRQSGIKVGLLKPLHPHVLRHSFATHLLSDGANLRILQELLGHQNLQATERYTHLSMDQLARTLEDFHPLGQNKDRNNEKNRKKT